MKTFKHLCFFFILVSNSLFSQSPKYIFYFIGDGMGINHVEASLIYQSKNNKDHTPTLVFEQFPFVGLVNTRSASNYITDSSAGGTALTTGVRIKNTELGVDTLGQPLNSILKKVQQLKWATGIVTTTSIDDATPASFYAHSKNRNNYYEVGLQTATSEIDFLGGGGFKSYTNPDNPDDPHLLEILKKHGYKIYMGYGKYCKPKCIINKKVILLPDEIYPLPYVSTPYVIDRKGNELSLPYLTGKAIEFLEDNKKSNFMLVVEGGRIDHASHTNDGATVIKEVIELGESVKLAYDFYHQHPEETLIIITSDHETGGMGLGNFNVNLNIQLLAHQKISLASLTNMIFDLKNQPETIAWDSISTIFKNKLGLWTKIPVTETEEKHLKEIYTETFIDKTENQVVTWYAKDEPLAVAAIDIVNKKSQLGWSTKSHSGSLVPIFAIGKGAENFTGYMLNTDIPKKIEMIVGL